MVRTELHEDTGYVCETRVYTEDGDFISGCTLHGLINSYVVYDRTISFFYRELTLPAYGTYNVKTIIYSSDGRLCGKAGTWFESYPLDGELVEDAYYEIFMQYGFELMAKINAIRKANGLRALTTYSGAILVANWRLDDLIACNVRNRRGLTCAYSVYDIEPTVFDEFFL